MLLGCLSHIKSVRRKWGLFSGAPVFCRNRGRQKVGKIFLKTLLDFASINYSSLFLRKNKRWASITGQHELAQLTSTPWGIWFLTSFSKTMPSCWGVWSATQKMMKQMTADEMGVPCGRHMIRIQSTVQPCPPCCSQLKQPTQLLSCFGEDQLLEERR